MKLLYLAVIVVSISSFAAGQANLIFNSLSALVTIGDYASTFFNSDEYEKSSWLEVDNSLMEFEQDFKHNFHLVMNNILELPNFLAFLLEQRNFREHLFRIHEMFRLTLRTRKQVDENFLNKDPVAKRKYIEDFVLATDSSVEESILEIRRIFIDTDTTGFTTGNITVNIKQFLNVCETKMSELQVYEYLLSLVQIAYGEYYQTKVYLLHFLKAYAPINIHEMKKMLKSNIDSDYQLIIIEFKKMMGTASRELWSCDARDYQDDTRYGNYAEYFELRQYSAYILNTNDNADPVCENNREPETCYETTKTTLCQKTRRCQLGFSECKTLNTIGSSSNARVCINDNVGAISRYYEINWDKTSYGKLKCQAGTEMELLYGEAVYCDCLCREHNYYFDDFDVVSNYLNQEVVTGARLAVAKIDSENTVIFIEVQTAQISKNGTIVSKPTWQIRDVSEITDSMLPVESVDLSEINDLGPNKVIIGFRFDQVFETKRVRLTVIAENFDYQTGELGYNAYSTDYSPKSSTEEFELEDQDVPTKSPQRSKPLSKSNQYVTFTITSKLKDGGQTTIPFIDTQNVGTGIRPNPLSGAGLYIRGQPGYGGFLALKLYTYDIGRFIDSYYYEDSILIDKPVIQI